MLGLYTDWASRAREKQLTPPGNWESWLILAGRGWGKTLTGAHDALLFALRHPGSQVAVVVPTFADLKRVAIAGPTGILSICPPELLKGGDREAAYNKTEGTLFLANGSKILGFTAEIPDRLRGNQFHRAWCDELAAWKDQAAWDNLQMGVRLGDDPRIVVTTTPRPTELVRGLAKSRKVRLSGGPTWENEANLPEKFVRRMRDKYEGTTLGRQELYAEILDDLEGALWRMEWIDRGRVRAAGASGKELEGMPRAPEDFDRVVVAVDPAATAKMTSDDTGVVVCAAKDGEYYVLADHSGRMRPEEWAAKAVELCREHSADCIVAEVNQGGDMVEAMIRQADPDAPYRAVRATRGKVRRAEPVAMLYERGKAHHVAAPGEPDRLKDLEDEMISYVGADAAAKKSPDRMDALVWGLTELIGSSSGVYWEIH